MTYNIPVISPYRVTQKRWLKNKRYSSAWYVGHMGIDYAWQVAWVPQDVHSSKAGRVVQSHFVAWRGQTIVIRHADWYETIYAHLSTRNVKLWQDVTDMQYIGMSGTTGSSTGVHLHFGIRPNKWHAEYKANNWYKWWIDPTPYLSTKIVYTKFEMDNAKNALHNNSVLWDSTIDPKMRKQLENTNDMIRKKYMIEK